MLFNAWQAADIKCWLYLTVVASIAKNDSPGKGILSPDLLWLTDHFALTPISVFAIVESRTLNWLRLFLDPLGHAQ